MNRDVLVCHSHYLPRQLAKMVLKEVSILSTRIKNFVKELRGWVWLILLILKAIARRNSPLTCLLWPARHRCVESSFSNIIMNFISCLSWRAHPSIIIMRRSWMDGGLCVQVVGRRRRTGSFADANIWTAFEGWSFGFGDGRYEMGSKVDSIIYI